MLITSFWRIPTTGLVCMYGFHKILLCINYIMSFLGGPVVKSLPANAGDMGSSPAPGAFHTPWGNLARVPQLLSPCPATREATTCSRNKKLKLIN